MSRYVIEEKERVIHRHSLISLLEWNAILSFFLEMSRQSDKKDLPGNQTNLQDRVLLSLADASGPSSCSHRSDLVKCRANHNVYLIWGRFDTITVQMLQ